MFILSKSAYDVYLKDGDDHIKHLFECSEPWFGKFQSHRWHMESPQKRFLYTMVYDLTGIENVSSILDVGGGITGLSMYLKDTYCYTLLDPIKEDPLDNSFDKISEDWYDYQPDSEWDVIIANDIFPNVDQRLDMFLDKYLPLCNTIRLSLTYYNKRPRYYKAKRIDGDEVLTLLSWNGKDITSCLSKYKHRIVVPKSIRNFNFIDYSMVISLDTESIFPNGRQVLIVDLKGDLA